VQAAVDDAIRNPGKYVLKPQREGGGNNLYGEDLRLALTSWDDRRLASHILMSRIFPPQQPGLLMRHGVIRSCNTVSELGIFGAFLGNSATGFTAINEASGYLVRTKDAEANEGGVASGFAVVSSLLEYGGSM
jgi:glutathione synthase